MCECVCVCVAAMCFLSFNTTMRYVSCIQVGDGGNDNIMMMFTKYVTSRLKCI